MVNEEARRERHAKLKQQNIQFKNPIHPGAAVSDFLNNSRQQLFKDQNNNPLITQLCKKIIGLTLAFLLISPLLTTYQITQGSYIGQFEEDLGVLEYTEQGAEYAIADIITEDGFLLKPAINSTEGDRTGFSEIFVYTVEPGDTLSNIAARFNLKKETLMAENNLWNPNSLRVGTKIKILPVDGLSHVIKSGETIDKIAEKYKVDKETIIAQNQLTGEEELVADATLIIPGAKRDAPVYASYTAPSAPANYTGPTAVGRLIWPTIGKVTQSYHRGHLAIDIGNRAKGPIYAAAGGKVVKASTGWNGGYGNVIIIDHGNGMQTLYAHNEKLYVTEGQYVEQGQTIGWMGNTGRVYGPTGIHLHFEVRIQGVKYNPMNFF
ncbi:M23 family metallopeptidase [Candidatus Peregrinibacteria bacterium]|nr:M23 family metallopeptidase [Candidatus Peregrinibacteria bacterium]